MKDNLPNVDIKLNIPCKICKKALYLSDNTAKDEKGFYHLECVLNKEKAKFLKLIDNFKTKIKMNGNLSNRIIENENGEFEHKHDFVLNEIVLEVIETLKNKYQEAGK